MTAIPLGAATAWVPEGCTLPTTDQPLRVSEFDSLFADTLTEIRRRVADRAEVTMLLKGPGDLAGRVQRLADAESDCCSFFTFRVGAVDRADAGRSLVELTVTVPATHVAVLDALVARAEATCRGRL